MIKKSLKKLIKIKSERKSRKIIYLDSAASFKPNPSSIHEDGIKAKKKLENARLEAAAILGARPSEIIFTSGGTESNNLAIQGIVYGWLLENTQIPHIITTNIEHPSVLETFKLLEKRKVAEISIVPVESNGILDPRKIKKEIKKNTILISVMYANNEIGTIQPIKEIAKAVRFHRKMNCLETPYFHMDAVQAVNYLDLNVERLGVDLVSLSGTKITEAGVGLLFKRKMIPMISMFGGGDQEFGLRPGTENLSEILKFVSALKKASQKKEKETKRLALLRDYFLKNLEKKSPVSLIKNGDLLNRLPNNVNLTFSKIPSDLLVIELSAKGIMVSSKSACKSSKKEGSYVISALRENADIEIGGLRLSMGPKTSKKDIDYTIKTLVKILIKLKKWYN